MIAAWISRHEDKGEVSLYEEYQDAFVFLATRPPSTDLEALLLLLLASSSAAECFAHVGESAFFPTLRRSARGWALSSQDVCLLTLDICMRCSVTSLAGMMSANVSHMTSANARPSIHRGLQSCSEASSIIASLGRLSSIVASLFGIAYRRKQKMDSTKDVIKSMMYVNGTAL